MPSGTAHGGTTAGSGSRELALKGLRLMLIHQDCAVPKRSRAIRFHIIRVHDRRVLSRCVTARQCLSHAVLIVNILKFIVFIATVN